MLLKVCVWCCRFIAELIPSNADVEFGSVRDAIVPGVAVGLARAEFVSMNDVVDTVCGEGW